MMKILSLLTLLIATSAQAMASDESMPNLQPDLNRPSDTRVVRCASSGYRYNTCHIGRARDVRIARVYSRAACIQDRTWGWDRGVIWVDRGCEADFYVYEGGGGGYPPPGGGYPPPPPSGEYRERVYCQSTQYGYNECHVRGFIEDVELIRQRPNTHCVLGRTWGWDRRMIWVDRGCEAEFMVYFNRRPY